MKVNFHFNVHMKNNENNMRKKGKIVEIPI